MKSTEFGARKAGLCSLLQTLLLRPPRAHACSLGLAVACLYSGLFTLLCLHSALPHGVGVDTGWSAPRDCWQGVGAGCLLTPPFPQWRRDVVTETKIIELVIVADHSEVSSPAPAWLPLTPPTLMPFTAASPRTGPEVPRRAAPDEPHAGSRPPPGHSECRAGWPPYGPLAVATPLLTPNSFSSSGP